MKRLAILLTVAIIIVAAALAAAPEVNQGKAGLVVKSQGPVVVTVKSGSKVTGCTSAPVQEVVETVSKCNPCNAPTVERIPRDSSLDWQYEQRGTFGVVSPTDCGFGYHGTNNFEDCNCCNDCN